MANGSLSILCILCLFPYQIYSFFCLVFLNQEEQGCQDSWIIISKVGQWRPLVLHVYFLFNNNNNL